MGTTTIITMTTMGMAMITMMIITVAMDMMTIMITIIMITITDLIMEESFMADEMMCRSLFMENNKDLMQKTKAKGRGGHKLGLKSHKNTNFSIPEIIMCNLFLNVEHSNL